MTDTNNSTAPVYVNVTEKGISMLSAGKMVSIAADNPNIDKIKQALRDKDYDLVDQLMNPTQTMTTWAVNADDPDFSINSGIVSYKGKSFSMEVSAKVLRMIERGLDAKPLLAFLRLVLSNPSASAQRELLLFCDANNFFIDEEGYVIAFKGVNFDYYDRHTGCTFLNTPGAVIEVPRGEVDDRRDVTCSFGLHFGSYDYAKGFGNRVMIVRVSPADVVSIPNDYNNKKGRCCKYQVVSELQDGQEPPQTEVFHSEDFPAVEPQPEEVPDYPIAEWRRDVGEGITSLGYEDWVAMKQRKEGDIAAGLEPDDYDDDLEDDLDDDLRDDGEEDEAEIEDDLISPLRKALRNGEITNKEAFLKFVEDCGFDVNGTKVVTALRDANFGGWLDQ